MIKFMDTVKRWITPPARQGQIVVVEYGSSHDGQVWRRTTDRSTPHAEPVIEVADASDCGCSRECGHFDPANREPSGYDWTRVA